MQTEKLSRISQWSGCWWVLCTRPYLMYPITTRISCKGVRLSRKSVQEVRERIITRTWINITNQWYLSSKIPDQAKPQLHRDMLTVDISWHCELFLSLVTKPVSPKVSHQCHFIVCCVTGGMQMYLSTLRTTDLIDYLTQGNVATTVGLFVGMAASRRGVCDLFIRRVCDVDTQ